MNDLDWLIIDALHKYKSISKTGRVLYISQPTLTKRLKHIENELGVKIASRGARGLYFTPQGEYLAKRAKEVIKMIEEIKSEVVSLDGNIAGTLRIGVSIYFSKYVLPSLLQDFRKEFPDVDFEVKTGHSSYIHNLIANNEIHVGFLRSDYDWQEEKYLLFEEKLCLVSRKLIQFKSLPKMEMIDYKKDYLLKGLVDKWWGENFASQPNIVMEVGSADICKEMVLRDLGYGILPYGTVKREREGLDIVDLKKSDGTLLKRNTWMYYHRETLDNSVVSAFVGFIKNYNFESDISTLNI